MVFGPHQGGVSPVDLAVVLCSKKQCLTDSASIPYRVGADLRNPERLCRVPARVWTAFDKAWGASEPRTCINHLKSASRRRAKGP